MFIQVFRNIKPAFQLFLTLGVWALTTALIYLAAILAAFPLFGVQETVGLLNGAVVSLDMLKYLQTVTALGSFVAPAMFAGWLFGGNISEYLHINRFCSVGRLCLSLLCLLTLLPFVNYTGELNSRMVLPDFLSGMETWMRDAESRAELLVRQFMDVKTVGGLLFNILMIAIIPAVGEEFLFRGVVQRQIAATMRNVHAGIWLTAALFSALHFQFFSFLPRLFLGALFGYLAIYTRTLWAPVFCHFMNNLLGVLSIYIINNCTDGILKDLASAVESGDATAWWLTCLSLLLCVAMLLKIRRNGGRVPERQEFSSMKFGQ
ncbi:MAG: CPBP family intramembrane metalloprotease [Bacteroidales bacterium]|jgi:membrane protease YdiL (CAAX protease family)|nr:CPBP family intramembrane metalloprotease [Bacteroidales bacterium]